VQTLASEGLLPIGEMRLEYRFIKGNPDDPFTIVMVHEGLGSVRTWGEFPRLLAEATGASVLAYSRDGYGSSPVAQSELSVDYIRRHALGVLPNILNEIDFTKGILLGHSDGASMALAYAGNIEDPRVKGLVLMAPHFCVEPETLAEIRHARTVFKSGDLRQRLARYHADVDAAFLRWNDVWLDPRFPDFDMTAELSSIRIPTLIIRGDEDRYGTHKQARMAERLLRNDSKIILMPDCGHIPHREKPQQTVEAIAAFCEKARRA
jgi:pimeloyl-ACP methyl ester carboxylesterase